MCVWGGGGGGHCFSFLLQEKVKQHQRTQQANISGGQILIEALSLCVAHLNTVWELPGLSNWS